eukprot:2516520-Lingulodinium_polyedra.AAC.1
MPGDPGEGSGRMDARPGRHPGDEGQAARTMDAGGRGGRAPQTAGRDGRRRHGRTDNEQTCPVFSLRAS